MGIVFLSNGATGDVPKNGEVISEKYNICLHTEPNSGSGDWINIFTYHCDKEINWEEGYKGDYKEKGVLDDTSVLRCEKAYLKDEGDTESKILYVEQIRWCAANLFNENRSGLSRLNVDENGLFTVLTF